MNPIVRTFYQTITATADVSIRWTSSLMLESDAKVILQAVASHPGFTWLDIGCGSGDLQRHLAGRWSFAVGVDAEPTMSRFWPVGPASEFAATPSTELEFAASVDLLTGFGLFTCINVAEEIELLEKACGWSSITIFMHQVAHEKEKVVSGYSEALKSEYWARYPSCEDQVHRLSKFWESVEMVRYPDELNLHPDTFHAAFVCRNN